MKLTTTVETAKGGFEISHCNRILLMGSCFTEHIGERLSALRFPICSNPFGILYNPLSMAESLRRCLDNEPIGGEQLVYHDGRWHSWLHHGVFSRVDRDACLDACNARIDEAHRFLNECDTVLLTFGSAWYYRQKGGEVVGNCHKVPAARFDLQMATVEEVVAAWRPLVQRLERQGVRMLFTVSPVRHWAYGAHGNQLGKAVLLLAIERLGVPYFPAYELLMDELRDYRFYADDMLHPSTLAEDIVWQRFGDTYMSEETQALCRQVERLNRLEQHRPMAVGSAEYEDYKSRLEQLRAEVAVLVEAATQRPQPKVFDE